MHIRRPLALLALALPSILTAQALDDAARARIDSVFAEYTRPGSPGCAVLVRRDGRTAYAHGYGFASIELGVPITARTVMDIGSSSKQFTAAAIWLLAQEGKLSLDDEVQRHIPELPRLGGQRVTIRQLLHHTSGWRDYNDLLVFEGLTEEQETGTDDALASLRRQRSLNFAPGTSWQYSNSGFFLASVIVERVSGTSMRDFLRTRIFAPLGMTQSDVFDDHTRVFPGRASSYGPGRDGWVAQSSNWEQTGDGAIQTSVEDLARWDENFDTPIVGGRALVDSLQQTVRLASGEAITYASGLSVEQWRGTRRVQHGGAWAAYRAHTFRLPELRTAIYLTCNAGSANTMRLAEQTAVAALGPALGAADSVRLRDSITLARAADFTAAQGLWLDPKGGRVIRIGAEGERLALGAPTAPKLRALGRLPDGALVLLPLDDNAPRWRFDARAGTLTSSSANGTEPWQRVAPVSPVDSAARAAIAGRFRSDELGSTWRLEASATELALVIPRQERMTLVPIFADGFRTPAGLVRLERDARGAVRGFTLTNRGVVGLRFTRQSR